jgi:hypothetical protein
MRRILLFALIAVCGFTRAAERPNIFFILADDMGLQDTRCVCEGAHGLE